MPRRGRPGHDRAAVLRGAIDLFTERGYDATSMGDLAKRLGISKATLYHHVDSKEQLLVAALEDALTEVTEVVAAAGRRLETGDDPLEVLTDVLRHSVEVLVAHQPAVTLLLRVRGNSEAEAIALERRRDLDHQLASLVRAARDSGQLRGDVDPDVVSRLLFGMVNSLVEWYLPEGAYDASAIAETVVAVSLGGLLPR